MKNHGIKVLLGNDDSGMKKVRAVPSEREQHRRYLAVPSGRSVGITS